MPENKGVNRMSEIKQHKQKKERGVSVQQVIDGLQENVGYIDSIVVALSYDDNTVVSAYSGDNDAELIGNLEIVKAELIDGMKQVER